MPKKPRSKQQADKAANQRLLKTYGITLAEYDEMLSAQDAVCSICTKPPVNRRLHVDHCHKFRYIKVHAFRLVKTQGWIALAEENIGGRVLTFKGIGCRKTEAVRDVRSQIKRASVRGLLCFRCNSGLEKFSDEPQRLLAAANYLTRFQNGH